MQRTIKNKPDLILMSDKHLREPDAQPICRLDNAWETQWIKLDFITSLQDKYGCPVVNAGDLFDKWKPSPYLLSKVMEHLPNQFLSIYGQHDLPEHNFKLRYKSGIRTLETAFKLQTLGKYTNLTHLKFCVYGCNWKESPVSDVNPNIINVLVWHTFTYQGKEPWPGCTDPKAKTLLRKYPQFDLILTGDNHTPFVEEFEGRLLVNPGSIMRMDADQINHRPRVYLWYAETNTVEPVYIPINPAIDVISREHLEHKKQRDKRINAFIDRLDNDWKVELSFENNLKAFQQQNKVDEQVMGIIYKSLEV
jgi:DNA repair exonuclease SbcCD nuclease subunit